MIGSMVFFLFDLNGMIIKITPMGMDLNTAFRMFMERTRMVRGLPFPAVLPETRMTREEARRAIRALRDEAADLPEMSLDEINAEINAVRAERRGESDK